MIALAVLSLGLAAAPVVPADPDAPAEIPRIRWMPWSDEAFRRAAEEKKGILLNVQAAWARTSRYAEEVIFSDPEVARYANEGWIPIRVDRDRRPDIDLRYQIAVRTVSQGESGWPLTAMLFENGEILYGRTLISPEDKLNRPGLRSLLARGAEMYESRADLGVGTRKMVDHTFDMENTIIRRPEIAPALIQEVAADLVKSLGPEFGGYGQSVRIPSPFALELAATLYHRSGETAYEEALVRTLRGMERGAIFDRLAGGFHRMTSDAAWRFPEFEKLLSYNSTILGNYLLGYQMTGDERFRRTAEATLDYILGTLEAPGGAFYVAQWAAASGQEPPGAYYAWPAPEFWSAIPEKHAPIARVLFNVTEQGEMILGPPPRSLLYLPVSRETAASQLKIGLEELGGEEEEMLAALRARRASRAAPPVEKEVYVDSSSLAVVALLESARALGRDDARDAALKALDRMLGTVPADGPLRHRLDPPPDPALDPPLALDHVSLARAALEGYEFTGRQRYLEAAGDLMERAVKLFWDDEIGGFYDIAADPNGYGYQSVRRRLPHDTAWPSLNAEAARVLDRLALHTDKAPYRERAARCIKGLVSIMRDAEVRHSGLALAIEGHLNPPVRYVVVAPVGDPRGDELLRAAHRLFHPGKVVMRLEPGRDDAAIRRLGSGKTSGTFAVRCVGRACSKPIGDPGGLVSTAPGS